MIDRNEIEILIEQYLDGDISPENKKELEYLLETDENLQAEFDIHLQMRRTFSWSMERESLRKKMEKFHAEFESNEISQSPPASKKRTGLRLVLVAASVSLFISVGSVLTYHFINKEKERTNSYATLNRQEFLEYAGEAAKNESSSDDLIEKSEEPASSQNIATAFAFTKDGYLLTNYHVVAGKKHVYVEKFQDSLQSYVAKVVDVDPRLDVALLKISDPRFIPFNNIPFVFASKGSMIGQKVFTLGYPKNDIVYSEGPISSLTGYKSDTIALQLSLPVNPGNSGAPVFTENGEVIGMIMGKNIENDGEAYGIKMNLILEFLSKQSEEIKLPNQNYLRNKKLTDQIQSISPFVFIIKA